MGQEGLDLDGDALELTTIFTSSEEDNQGQY